MLPLILQAPTGPRRDPERECLTLASCGFGLSRCSQSICLRYRVITIITKPCFTASELFSRNECLRSYGACIQLFC